MSKDWRSWNSICHRYDNQNYFSFICEKLFSLNAFLITILILEKDTKIAKDLKDNSIIKKTDDGEAAFFMETCVFWKKTDIGDIKSITIILNNSIEYTM